MLRKVYLTPALPGKEGVGPHTVSAKTYPDIYQKVRNYQKEKKGYLGPAPPLRPHPLEKYDRPLDEEGTIDVEARDEKIIMGQGEEEEADEEQRKADEQDTTLRLEDRYAGTINSLPSHVRRRAWRLLPFLLDKDIGELNMRDLLYDLTVPAVKKIHSQNLSTLRTVYRQLDNDQTLPKTYYVRKTLPKAGSGVVKFSKRQSMMPQREKFLPQVVATPRGAPATPFFYSKASVPGSRAYGDEAAPTATSTPLVEEDEEEGAGEEAPSTPQRQFQTPPHTQRQWPSSIRKENRRKKDAKVLASLKWE